MSVDRPLYPDVERKALLDLVPAGVQRVLDIGCNQGGFGAGLKGRGPVEVWGVEPDPHSASVAASRLDHVVVDYFEERNPLPDGYFDLIVFNDSLEHMPDPVAALELARRKLQPGGVVQCCVPNMRHIECLEHLLLEKNWAYEEQGVRDRTHLRFFTKRSIVELFESLGYRVQRTVFVNEEWWEPGRKLRRLLFRVFPRQTHDMRYKQVVVIAQ